MKRGPARLLFLRVKTNPLGFFEHCGGDMQAMPGGSVPPPQLFPERTCTRSGCPHRGLSSVPHDFSSAPLHASAHPQTQGENRHTGSGG